MFKNWRTVAKAIAAFLLSAGTTIGTWAGTLAPGPITGREWITLAGALLAPFIVSFGVYQTKNATA